MIKYENINLEFFIERIRDFNKVDEELELIQVDDGEERLEKRNDKIIVSLKRDDIWFVCVGLEKTRTRAWDLECKRADSFLERMGFSLDNIQWILRTHVFSGFSRVLDYHRWLQKVLNISEDLVLDFVWTRELAIEYIMSRV